MRIVRSNLSTLPFSDLGFSWSTFELFFCDFLNAGTVLQQSDGSQKRIISAERYGRPGDKQNGIDIVATMEGGSKWVFQCKHFRSTPFGPSEANTVIEKCSFDAERYFIVITKEVSEACKNGVRAHSKWDIWGPEKITRAFRDGITNKLEAARLLYVHFGPGWPEQFFDIPDHWPLMKTEAKYQHYLTPGRSFHHRLPLQGRSKTIKQLDQFSASKTHRICLLPGRAGIGKSKLNLEWSRSKSSFESGITLYQIADRTHPATEYIKAIELAAKPLVLVLDDAHRFPEIRRLLFSIVAEPERKEVKLILLTRPNQVSNIRTELIETGIDTRQIAQFDPLLSLKPTQHRQIVEHALEGKASSGLIRRIAAATKDSPLLALLATELWKSEELDIQYLTNSNDFKDHVFHKGFEREVQNAHTSISLNASKLTHLIQAIALLSPVHPEKESAQLLANLIDRDLKSYEVSDAIYKLVEAGLLTVSSAGYRIVPDLLSDHLVYTACYTPDGKDRGFIDSILDTILSDAKLTETHLSNILLHLAEAEWMARRDHSKPDSVFESTWKWFSNRFANSSIEGRFRQLEQWKSIAYLQPDRTLQIIHQAIDLTEAPKEHDQVLDISHSDLLKVIPSIIEQVAVYSTDHTKPCLDLLWHLATSSADQEMKWKLKQSPVETMAEIAKPQIWKSIQVSESVLSWMEDRWLNPPSLESTTKPWSITKKVLKSFFTTTLEASWQESKKIHLRSYFISLSKTQHIRDKARSICEKMTSFAQKEWTLGALDVLETATLPVQPRFSKTVPRNFEKQWLEERIKSLALIAKILKNNPEPLVQFKARHILIHFIHANDAPIFESNCRQILKSANDTLDIRLARATLSHAYQDSVVEIEHKSFEKRYKAAERQWSSFLNNLAEELSERNNTGEEMISLLTENHQKLSVHGFKPNWRPLLTALSENHPALALEMAHSAIQSSSNFLHSNIDLLILGGTHQDKTKRLALCKNAFQTNQPDLVTGAIYCMAFWRREEGGLPQGAWNLLSKTAFLPSNTTAFALLQFVLINESTWSTNDLDLLSNLPTITDESIAQMFLERVADLIGSDLIEAAPELVSLLLNKLQAIPSLRTMTHSRNALAELSESFPDQVFLFLWNRLSFSKKQSDQKYEPLPYEMKHISMQGAHNHPDILVLFQAWLDQLCVDNDSNYNEYVLFTHLISENLDNLEQSLLIFIPAISSSDRIYAIVSHLHTSLSLPLGLHHSPKLQKSILNHALGLGSECYQNTLRLMSCIPGGHVISEEGPGKDWQSQLATIEKLAHEHADDPHLGQLYRETVSNERKSMEHSVQRLIKGTEFDSDWNIETE